MSEEAAAHHHPLCVKYYSSGDLPCIGDILDEHAIQVRADERAKGEGIAQGMVAQARRDERDDLRAKVEAIEGYSTFGPDGSLDGADAVLRSDVIALLPELSCRPKNNWGTTTPEVCPRRADEQGVHGGRIYALLTVVEELQEMNTTLRGEDS